MTPAPSSSAGTEQQGQSDPRTLGISLLCEDTYHLPWSAEHNGAI